MIQLFNLIITAFQSQAMEQWQHCISHHCSHSGHSLQDNGSNASFTIWCQSSGSLQDKDSIASITMAASQPRHSLQDKESIQRRSCLSLANICCQTLKMQDNAPQSTLNHRVGYPYSPLQHQWSYQQVILSMGLQDDAMQYALYGSQSLQSPTRPMAAIASLTMAEPCQATS